MCGEIWVLEDQEDCRERLRLQNIIGHVSERTLRYNIIEKQPTTSSQFTLNNPKRESRDILMLPLVQHYHFQSFVFPFRAHQQTSVLNEDYCTVTP